MGGDLSTLAPLVPVTSDSNACILLPDGKYSKPNGFEYKDSACTQKICIAKNGAYYTSNLTTPYSDIGCNIPCTTYFDGICMVYSNAFDATTVKPCKTSFLGTCYDGLLPTLAPATTTTTTTATTTKPIASVPPINPTIAPDTSDTSDTPDTTNNDTDKPIITRTDRNGNVTTVAPVTSAQMIGLSVFAVIVLLIILFFIYRRLSRPTTPAIVNTTPVVTTLTHQ